MMCMLSWFFMVISWLMFRVCLWYISCIEVLSSFILSLIIEFIFRLVSLFRLMWVLLILNVIGICRWFRFVVGWDSLVVGVMLFLMIWGFVIMLVWGWWRLMFVVVCMMIFSLNFNGVC